MTLGLFGNVGVWEILIILAVVALLFGTSRVPAMGRSMGRGLREFKDSVGATGRELRDAIQETPDQVREVFGGDRISLDDNRQALPAATPPPIQATVPAPAPVTQAAPAASEVAGATAEVVDSTAEEIPADDAATPRA